MIIDLDKFKEPPIDEDGQYDFINYPDIEDVSIGKVESSKLNYAASEMIDLLLSSGLIRNNNRELYMTFFGNLYWSGNNEFKINKDLCLKNIWGETGYYSISTNSMKRIISLEPDIDFKIIMLFFSKMIEQKKKFDISFHDFFEITQNWLSLYKLAVIKDADIVYDIG
ncbi:hypothetical protein [uncultured Microscilla sp.]|uniref:hypothetical protein n=1 Tax=uncultured Microscilla sp. TaxID=432653 RepID=UPI0026351D1F|nr:hypothetical protein [uncultured Microscilla sp.]